MDFLLLILCTNRRPLLSTTFWVTGSLWQSRGHLPVSVPSPHCQGVPVLQSLGVRATPRAAQFGHILCADSPALFRAPQEITVERELS